MCIRDRDVNVPTLSSTDLTFVVLIVESILVCVNDRLGTIAWTFSNFLLYDASTFVPPPNAFEDALLEVVIT